MIPILPAASVLVPVLIGLAGSVLQITWDTGASECDDGDAPPDGPISKLAGTKVASTTSEKVAALHALFVSSDFKGLTGRVETKGNELRQYVSGALDSLGAAESPGPGSRGGSSSDLSLAAECERALGDLDVFLGITGMIAAAKQAALVARNAWVTEAEGLETVIDGLVEEMASVDAELHRILGPPDKAGTGLIVLKGGEYREFKAAVRNCQSAAVSRMNSLKEILKMGLEGVEHLFAGTKAACSQFPEPDGTNLTALGIRRSTLDGWVVLVAKDIAAADKAHTELERVAKPFLEQSIFQHLAYFKPYRVEHVTKAIDDVEELLE